jgi:hypothetical protein
MEMLSGEVEVMGKHLAFGGQQHCEAVCDSYMLAHFMQKERLPHTNAEKMKEVLKHLHFTNAEEVARVAMSSSTIARCPFPISILKRGNIIYMCVCVCMFAQKIYTCVCVCVCVNACVHARARAIFFYPPLPFLPSLPAPFTTIFLCTGGVSE